MPAAKGSARSPLGPINCHMLDDPTVGVIFPCDPLVMLAGFWQPAEIGRITWGWYFWWTDANTKTLLLMSGRFCRPLLISIMCACAHPFVEILLYPSRRAKIKLTISVQGSISDWLMLLTPEVAPFSHPTWFISMRVCKPIVKVLRPNIVATINGIRLFGVHRPCIHAWATHASIIFLICICLCWFGLDDLQ